MKIGNYEFDIEDVGFGDGSVSIQFAETFKNKEIAEKELKHIFTKKDDTISFSYRDVNSEIQHAEVKLEDAGKYIGDLETTINKLQSIIQQFKDV